MNFVKRKEKDFLFQGHDVDEVMRRDVSSIGWLPNCAFLEFKWSYGSQRVGHD